MNRPATAGQLGTGVIAKDIQRARDGFLDAQWRTESSSLANATNRQDALQQVEVVLDEPQGVGLNSQLNDYYKAWNDSDERSRQGRDVGAHHGGAAGVVADPVA